MRTTLNAGEIHEVSRIVLEALYQNTSKPLSKEQYSYLERLLDEGMHDSVNSIIADIGRKMNRLDFPLRWDRG